MSHRGAFTPGEPTPCLLNPARLSPAALKHPRGSLRPLTHTPTTCDMVSPIPQLCTTSDRISFATTNVGMDPVFQDELDAFRQGGVDQDVMPPGIVALPRRVGQAQAHDFGVGPAGGP